MVPGAGKKGEKKEKSGEKTEGKKADDKKTDAPAKTDDAK